jgi:hypothetical protein
MRLRCKAEFAASRLENQRGEHHGLYVFDLQEHFQLGNSISLFTRLADYVLYSHGLATKLFLTNNQKELDRVY